MEYTDEELEFAEKFGDCEAFPTGIHHSSGLTKLEYMAMVSLQGIMSNSHIDPNIAADYAVEFAEALLRRLARKKLTE